MKRLTVLAAAASLYAGQAIGAVSGTDAADPPMHVAIRINVVKAYGPGQKERNTALLHEADAQCALAMPDHMLECVIGKTLDLYKAHAFGPNTFIVIVDTVLLEAEEPK